MLANSLFLPPIYTLCLPLPYQYIFAPHSYIIFYSLSFPLIPIQFPVTPHFPPGSRVQNVGHVDHKYNFHVYKKYWKVMEFISPRKE